jgi:hypothetical protein
MNSRSLLLSAALAAAVVCGPSAGAAEVDAPCAERWIHRTPKKSGVPVAYGCPVDSQPWLLPAPSGDPRVIVIDKLNDANVGAARGGVVYIVDTSTGEIVRRAAISHGVGLPFSQRPKRQAGDGLTPEGSFTMVDVRQTLQPQPGVIQDRLDVIGKWFVLLSYPSADRSQASGANGNLGGAIGLHGGRPSDDLFPPETNGCIRFHDSDLEDFLQDRTIGLKVVVVNGLDSALRTELMGCDKCNKYDITTWLDGSIKKVPQISGKVSTISLTPGPKNEPFVLTRVSRTSTVDVPSVSTSPAPTTGSGSSTSEPPSSPPAPQRPPVDQAPAQTSDEDAGSDDAPSPPQNSPNPPTERVPVPPTKPAMPPNAPESGPPELTDSKAALWQDRVKATLRSVGLTSRSSRRTAYEALMRSHWPQRPNSPSHLEPVGQMDVFSDENCSIKLSGPNGISVKNPLEIHYDATHTGQCVLAWHHESESGDIGRFIGYVNLQR